VDSAGSDDVTLCLSIEEVQAAFGNIMGKINGLGIVNKAVLVQEYLEGTEYIVDMVSRDGEHKLAAIWAYDRRAVNGAGFVCFGQHLLLATDPHCREIIDYQKKVITALGIRNGPTHGEVKWFQGEPVLVEVGARCQGADGLWVKLATEALGYNQVQCAIDSYLYPERFALMPDEVGVINFSIVLLQV
jgi:biotin carboxylase